MRTQCRLGVTCALGSDVTMDDAGAVEWFRAAAIQKHADAQFYLADWLLLSLRMYWLLMCVHLFSGTEVDVGRAAEWLKM